jgi:YVTN family beta-propeller protein
MMILRVAAVAVWIGALVTLAVAACSTQPPTESRSTSPAAMPPAAGPRLFVSNEISGTVSVVDITTRQVVYTIAVGKRPRGIRTSPDGRIVYVALSGSPIGGPNVDESKLPPPDRRFDGIGVIDAHTGALTRVLQGGTDPEQFALSADGQRLFIANEDAALTTVLDVNSGQIVRQITVGGEPEGVDLSPDGASVYVTSENDNQVHVIDASSLQLVKVIAVGPRPRSTGFLPNQPRAYVSAENGAAVDVIDTRTHQVLRRITFPSDTLRPMGVLAAPDGSQVFVTTGRGGSLEILDAKTDAIRGSVRVGERPWGLAVSPDGRMVFTANGPSNDVSLVDVASMSVTARVPVGERPWGVTVVPGR